MTRQIACYVIFITLIWGASTENEEKIRNLFKSNMTRGDFSNLLKSLIRLNEQRVNVLQKLYRLEDYSVLSEVLRSGDKKKGNGNLSNLFLVVLSKNHSDPSRRNMGFQVVDSVPSLDTGNSHVGGTPINVSKTANSIPGYQMNNNKFVLNLGDNSERRRDKYDIDDRSENSRNTKQGSSHVKNKDQESVVTMENNDKPQGRFAIVSNGGIINTHKEASDDEDSDDDDIKSSENIQKRESAKTTNSETNNDESNENDRKKIRLTIQRPYEMSDSQLHKLDRDATKEGNRKKPPNTNKGNPREKISGNKNKLSKDIPVLTNHGKKHPKQNIEKSANINHSINRPKLNKEKLNANIHVKKHPSINIDESDEEQQDEEETPDNSNEDAFYVYKENKNDNDSGDKKSKINKDESNEYIPDTKHTKISRNKSADNLQGIKFSKINTEHSSDGHMITFNLDKPLNPKITKDVSDDEDDHKIKYPPISTEMSNENMHNYELSKITNDGSDENDYYNSRPKDAKGSHQDKPTLARVVFDDGNKKSKMGRDFDSTGKLSAEDYGGLGEGSRDKTSVSARDGPLTPFDENYKQPEAGRESRKTFAKCINKKAFKMCTKSCISAYKNVCRRLKCTSRSKRALKKECKRSCKKTFSSKSSKYSDESDDSNSS